MLKIKNQTFAKITLIIELFWKLIIIDDYLKIKFFFFLKNENICKFIIK